MKKIFLFCETGMSTSIMATKMRFIADDKQVPVRIEAYPILKVHTLMEEDTPDCIVLGAKLRHLFNDIQKRYEEWNIPIHLLELRDHTMIDPEQLLTNSVEAIKNKAVNA